MVRFLQSLDRSTAEKVDLQPYWSFEDVCKLANKVEKYSKTKKSYTNSYSYPKPPHQSDILPLKSKHKPKKICLEIKVREFLGNSLSNLMAKGVLNAKNMDISMQIVLIKEFSPSR